MDPELLLLVAFFHLIVFVPHAMFISACETKISMSDWGFNSFRWFILILLDVGLLTRLIEASEQIFYAQKSAEHECSAVIPDKKVKQKKSTWFKIYVQVLCCAATCAFLFWGAVTLYRHGTDPIKRVAYCIMVLYPAPFLWCMKRLSGIEETDVKTQKQLKFAMYFSLNYMLSNDTFCYGILAAGMTVHGAAILAIVVFALSEWFCFFITTDLVDDEEHNHNSDRHIGNILTYAAIYVLILWGIISVYQFRAEDLFVRATYYLTILSPIPSILCAKTIFYESAELTGVAVIIALVGSLSFMSSCGVFSLYIMSSIRPIPEKTLLEAVVLAFLTFVAVLTSCSLVYECCTQEQQQETASRNDNIWQCMRCQAYHTTQPQNSVHSYPCCVLVPQSRSQLRQRGNIPMH